VDDIQPSVHGTARSPLASGWFALDVNLTSCDDMPDEAALHFCRVGYKAMEASMVYSVMPAPRLLET
jgi:hypothetical protein